MKQSSNNKNNKNEMFFKNLASSYAEKSGGELKTELADLNSAQSSDVLRLDTKVKNRIQTNKIKKWTSRLIPIAACFLILMFSYHVLRTPMKSYNNAPNYDADSNNVQDAEYANPDFSFISEKLPPEYIIEKIDYDQQKTIYYIVGNKNTEIILTVEEFTENINADDLDIININGKDTYGISNEDFSFLQYTKDNLLYMLTTPNNYDDLIKISEYLI